MELLNVYVVVYKLNVDAIYNKSFELHTDVLLFNNDTRLC